MTRGGGFGGQPNMQQLMKQAQKMQQQLEAAQSELASTEVTGTAGGGLVTATLLGSGELTALTIDPQAVDPDDVAALTVCIDYVAERLMLVRDGADDHGDKQQREHRGQEPAGNSVHGVRV